MKIVGFITPKNEFISMKYHEVMDFCKNICESEENRESFFEFARMYSYFTPYFDYVMMNKKYLFVNPLYMTKQFAIFDKGAYYSHKLQGFDYIENVDSYKREKKELIGNPSSLTVVSDSELGIKKQNVHYTDDCLIDPNMMGMMSMTGVLDKSGSHSVTGASVLNQLLCKSKALNNDFSKYVSDFENRSVLDGIELDYLVSRAGFLHVGARDVYLMIICNEKIISDECRKFIEDSIKEGYKFFRNEGEYDNFVIEYQENVRRTTK